MSMVAVVIGGLLATGGNLTIFLDPLSPVYIAMIIVFAITGAGNVINDYVDVEADKVNKPKRPIPSGRVSPRSALAFSVFMFALGITLSAVFLTNFALILAAVNSALLVVYSYNLQNKILIGNVTVGYLAGSTLLFGGAAMGNLFLPFLLMLLAMFSTITREIIKDLEDLEGDKKSFMKRLASEAKRIVGERFGIRDREAELKITKSRAKYIAIASMVLAIAASPLPYMLGVLGFVYLAILVPAVIMFSWSILKIHKARTKKEFYRASKLIKLGMNIGLLAFIAGVLI